MSDLLLFLFSSTPTTEIYTLSLHDALPICGVVAGHNARVAAVRVHGERRGRDARYELRSEEHTSELQSRGHLVCRLLLEKKKRGNCLPGHLRAVAAFAATFSYPLTHSHFSC